MLLPEVLFMDPFQKIQHFKGKSIIWPENLDYFQRLKSPLTFHTQERILDSRKLSFVLPT